MKVYHWDVNTAFLDGELKETILTKQPEGIKGKEHLICELNISIHGLKLEAKAWNVIVYYVPRHILRVITRRATMLAGDRSQGVIET